MQTDIYEAFVIHRLDEAGLARVLTREGKATDMALLTAFRGEYDYDENMRRNRELETELNARKMGAYHLIGHWQECEDTTVPYELCPKSKLRDTVERSFMVIKPDDMTREYFQSIVMDYVKRYNQDAALIKEGMYYYILDRSGAKYKVADHRRFGISKAYSQFVRKRNVPFVFEGILKPTTIMGRRLAEARGVLYPCEVTERAETVLERIARLTG